ncbi:amino acid adenylation domain-containing protein [Clostridium estertheticum]|uniref:amino acid adenylation domain-containing protein n=1 Tax=Clostridium estertheticum TaxID=238834 RepID=UPI0013EE7739|nr:amino acid adenylation domain-containing protein [Clostridium estertheticum]MBZ9609063.1 amino acid adenylation domain-containing protein [Clostridium estertheticum]
MVSREECKEYPSNKTIHQLFEEKVNEFRDKVAIQYENQTLFYSELNERANELADYLISRGVKINDHVGVIVKPSVNMIVSLLAVLKCGAIYVPIEPDYPNKRVNYIMENSKAVVAIVDGEYCIPLENKIKLQDLELSTYSKENPNLKKSSKELAYIMYTSGSTGMPKGVMIEHHSAVNLIKWVNKTFEINSSDKALLVTSMCFDLSVYDIFGMLDVGGTIVICPKKHIMNTSILKDIMKKEKITFWNSVPITINSLVSALEERNVDFQQSNLKNIFLSGDWIPLNLVNKLKKYFPNANITSLGGATEATVWSIYYPIKEIRKEWISIPYGKPIDNNYFYILDNEFKPVPNGEIGELYIAGVGIARGYVNDIVKTEKAFMEDIFRDSSIDKMYKTGDLGRMMEDGNIEFIGRCDDQVKIRGFRIELKEIEKQLLNYDDVRDAIVLAKNNTKEEKYLCAYIVTNATINIKDVKKHLGEILPQYMIPSIFIFLEEFPLNANGKIDKKLLPDVSTDSIITDIEYTACSCKLEREICSVWEQVLGLYNIGINHDFFEIGGTSIEATYLESELNKIGVRITYDEIISNSTVKKQADYTKVDRTVKRKDDNEEVAIADNCHTKSQPIKPDPFNKLFYKNCFYNSLFPIINYFNRNINSFLCNDIFIYSKEINEENTYLNSYYIEDIKVEEILEKICVAAIFTKALNEDELIKKIFDGLRKKELLIVWVDSFYQSARRDTYMKKHVAHTLLVYDYDEKNENFYIMDHSHKDALNYKERVISKEDLVISYMGYLDGLMTKEDRYTFVEFYDNKVFYNYDLELDKKTLIENYDKYKDSILDGVRFIDKFRENYSNNYLNYKEIFNKYAYKVISYLNKIIDFKRAEKYRIETMFMERNRVISRIDEVMNGWIGIRNDLVKFTKNIPLSEEKIKEHCNSMQLIYVKELEILDMMVR